MIKLELFRGKRISDMSKDELIETINELAELYRDHLEQSMRTYQFIRELHEKNTA